ncbi:hypothetical protein GCM10022631_05710 [Deinococcus rubellus]|uniref:Lipoprotein n=1 Tax=Deinococcus rubellus TaxID=1889240 RepID=A0ABY5YG60_9DEIO|nr:hypothetical protein [Deinococcus rubellus]UWX64079.1 hypothetical protein N0D28_15420 [Deinococcus rubellus]
MKRLALPLLFAPLLWACGTATGPALSAPPLSAGELLAAPTKLTIGGARLSAEAAPVLSAPLPCSGKSCAANFVVPVKLRASGDQSSLNLSSLKVTGVYVITEGGVWRSGVAAQDSRRCAAVLEDTNCLQAVGRGNADLSPHDAVQVVLTFRDPAGRSYQLRDSKAIVSGGH